MNSETIGASNFSNYCYQFPFSEDVINDFNKTIKTINPQDTQQILKLIDNIEQLPIKNVQLILVPNQLTVIVYQNLDNVFQFGFFEIINDQALANQCFDYIKACITDDNELFGPINFSTFFNYRLKVNCFERPNFLGEPNNLHYYPDILKASGFMVNKTYHSQYSDAQVLETIIENELNLEFLEIAKQGFDIKPITKQSLPDFIADIYALVLGQFDHKSEFKPISLDLFKDIYMADIEPYIHPQYSFVYYLNDQLAGFNFMFDHQLYADKFNLDDSIHTSDLIYKTVCIHKQYQGKGLFKLMNANTLSKYPRGISTTGATMENSQFVLNYSAKYGAVKTIDYALYRK